MSWGKKKKHASQNTIPAAEFRQEGESALLRKRQRNHQNLRRENIWITRFPFPNDMVRKEMITL